MALRLDDIPVWRPSVEDTPKGTPSKGIPRMDDIPVWRPSSDSPKSDSAKSDSKKEATKAIPAKNIPQKAIPAETPFDALVFEHMAPKAPPTVRQKAAAKLAAEQPEAVDLPGEPATKKSTETVADLATPLAPATNPDVVNYIKEVAGNAVGMLLGSGVSQQQAKIALLQSKQAREAIAKGEKYIHVSDLEDVGDISDPNGFIPGFIPLHKKVLAKDYLLSDTEEIQLRRKVAALPVAVGKAYQGTESAIEEGKKKPNLENLEKSSSNMQAGALQLLNQIAQTGEAPPKRGFMGALEKGQETGEAMTAGAVGGTAAIARNFVEHPIDTTTSLPLETVTTVLPAVGAVGKLAKAGAYAAAPAKAAALAAAVESVPAIAKTAKLASRAVNSGVTGALLGGDAGSLAIGGVLGAALPGLAKFLGFLAPEQVASFQRWFLDRAKQSTAGAEAVVREILGDPQRVRSEIESLGKESAGRVKQGDVQVQLDWNKYRNTTEIAEYNPYFMEGRRAEVYDVDARGNPVRRPQAAAERVEITRDAPMDTELKKSQIEAADQAKQNLEQTPRPQQTSELRKTVQPTAEQLKRIQDARAAEDAAKVAYAKLKTGVVELVRKQREAGKQITIKDVDPRLTEALKKAKENADLREGELLLEEDTFKEAVQQPTPETPEYTQYKKSQAELAELTPDVQAKKAQAEVTRLEAQLAEVSKPALSRVMSPAEAAAVKDALTTGKSFDEVGVNAAREAEGKLPYDEAAEQAMRDVPDVHLRNADNATNPVVDARRVAEVTSDLAEARKVAAQWEEKAANSTPSEANAARIAELEAQNPPTRAFDDSKVQGVRDAIAVAEVNLTSAKVRLQTLERQAAELVATARSQSGKATPAQKAQMAIWRDAIATAREEVAAAERAPALEAHSAQVTAREAARQSAREAQALAKEPLPEGRGIGGSPAERDIAAGIKVEAPDIWVRVNTTNNPQFESAVTQAHETLAGIGYKDADGYPISREEVASRFAEALQSRSIELLRSPKVRDAVLKTLLEELNVRADNAGKKLLTQVLDSLGQGSLEKANAIIGGKVVTDIIGAVVRKFGPKMMPVVRAQAMEVIVGELAGKAQEAHFKGLIEKETNRFPIPEGEIDPVAPMIAIAEGIAKGERPPLVLPKGLDPKEFAQYLRTEGLPLLRGKYPKAITKKLEVFANQLDKYFVNSEVVPGSYVQRGFESSVGYALKASKASQDIGGVAAQVSNYLKGAITSRSLKSSKNNVGGNLSYQTVRTGLSVPELVTSIVDAATDWLDYEAGKVKDPAKLIKMRAIGRTGLIDTSLLEAEMGGIGGTARVENIPLIGKPLAALNKALDTSYKFGDTAFKMDEVSRGFNKIRADLDSLAVGKHIELDIGNGRTARVTKLSNTEVKLDSPINPRERIRIDSQEVANNVAEAAQKTARDVFFDYADVPHVLTWMRSQGGLSIASPFFVWPWKAMDIPGFKPGLLQHLLDYDGAGMYRTNDPTLLAQNAARSGALALRRSATLQANKALVPQDQENIKKSLQFNPRGMSLMNLGAGHDEDSIQYRDWSGNNWMGQTDLIWRLGTKGLTSLFGLIVPEVTPLEQLKAAKTAENNLYEANKMIDNTDLEKAAKAKAVAMATDELKQTKTTIQVQRAWARHAKGLFNLSDALALAGAEGGILFRLLTEKLQKKGFGREPSMGDITREVMQSILGGTMGSLVDVVAGSTDALNYSALTARGRSYDTKDPTVEEGIRYGFRTVLGVGMREAQLSGRTNKYLAKMSKTMMDSAVAEADAYLDRLNKQIDDEFIRGKLPSAEVQKQRDAAIEKYNDLKRMMEDIANDAIMDLTDSVNSEVWNTRDGK